MLGQRVTLYREMFTKAAYEDEQRVGGEKAKDLNDVDISKSDVDEFN